MVGGHHNMENYSTGRLRTPAGRLKTYYIRPLNSLPKDTAYGAEDTLKCFKKPGVVVQWGG